MKKMRKLLAGLMASLTLVSALPAAAAASPLDVISSSGIVYAAGNGLLSIPMYVLTSNPNNRLILRAGASTSSAIVGYLSYGTKVTVHRVTTSGWAKVTANGKTGYVSARYLTASNPNAAASTTIMFVKTSRPGSNLNMRAGASTSSSVVASLAYGTKVTVHSISGSWAKVTANGKTGYVSTQYLSKTDPAGGNASVSTTYEMFVSTSRPTSRLTMRDRASTSGSVVTYLSYGTKVTVHSTSNGWAKVTANGKTGYVSTQYLSKTNPAASNSGSTSVTPASGDMGPLMPAGAYFRGERDDKGLDGKKWHGNHDINGVSTGTTIQCPADATVYYRQAVTLLDGQYKLTSYGNHVDIRCDNGYRILLAHLSEFEGVDVQVTATKAQGGSDKSIPLATRRLNAGDLIGYVGTTGNSTAAHVHIEVYDAAGNRIDPAKLFPSMVR